jgi:hypothetical protein
MAVYAANIVIEQGYDFYTNFELEDAANNQPKNLVGYGVTAQVRKTYSSTNSVSFASSIANASNGVISISLTSTQTSALKPGRYVYDVMLQQGGLGSSYDKTKAVEGMALVRGGVTR